MLKAQVENPHVEVDQPFVIRYTFSGIEGTVQLPESKDIELLRKLSQGPFTQIINGHRTDGITMDILAVARNEGDLILQPAIVTSEGKKYKTNSITLHARKYDGRRNARTNQQGHRITQSRGPHGNQQTITRPKTAPQRPHKTAPESTQIPEGDASKLVFLRSTIDNKSPYVGEAVTLTTKLYFQVPFRTEELDELPKYKGFWHESADVGDPMQNIREETLNGKQYRVMTIAQETLYPLHDGTLKISPLKLDAVAQIPYRTRQRRPSLFDDLLDDPFMNNNFGMSNFFRQFLEQTESMFETVSYKEVPLQLSSGYMEIKVRPIPKDAEGNTPVLGKYTIKASLAQHKITMDDIDTLTLTISGYGNPEFISPPQISHPELDFFSVTEEDSITSRSPRMQGYKKITYIFTPNNTGSITLDSIGLSYFDPKTEKIHQVFTDPMSIEVSPGKVLSKKESIERSIPRDIHHIQRTENEDYWIASPWSWTAWSLPFFAYILLGFYTKRKEALLADTRRYKMQQANKVALERLNNAKAYMEQNLNVPFYSEISKALWLYISDKSAIPLSQINKDRVELWLRENEINDETMDTFFETTEQAELKLYANDDEHVERQSTYDRALEAITNLESELS